MLIVGEEEVDSESDLLEDCPQFISKMKTSTFCLCLPTSQVLADQENARKSEILESGVRRIFKEANNRICGWWDATARQTLVQREGKRKKT